MSQIIVTETLAKLYMKHGAPDKAREIYSLLIKQNPNRDDYKAIFNELDHQTKIEDKPTPDYRQTLDEGFATDQNGMSLNEAIDAFEEKKQEYDPELMDQIMLMTDYEEALQQMEANKQQLPIITPPVMSDPAENESNNTSNQTEQLTKAVNQWLDLVLIKRKMDQLKKIKQRIH
jgi:tetratricopeptide (TPR) repeat protein